MASTHIISKNRREVMNFLDLKFKFKNLTGDIVSGAFLALFSGLCLVYIIPKYVALGFGNTYVTPQSFPKVVAAVTLCFGLFIMIRGIVNVKKGTEPKQVSFAMSSLCLCVIGIAYAVLFEIVGYIPLNIVCIPVVYYMFGGKKWWEAAIISVVFTAICVLFFKVYLQLVIPLVWW